MVKMEIEQHQGFDLFRPNLSIRDVRGNGKEICLEIGILSLEANSDALRSTGEVNKLILPKATELFLHPISGIIPEWPKRRGQRPRLQLGS